MISREQKKVLKTVFAWLSNYATSSDVILIKLDSKARFYNFNFPLKYGDSPRRIKEDENNNVTFILRNPKLRDKLLHIKEKDQNWEKVFSTPIFEVLEKRERKGHFMPLRWGLNAAEKKTALEIARYSLETFLSSGEQLSREYFKTFPERLSENTDLDVALWVDGQLRGSAVLENQFVSEGIAKAAVIASRDSRFKPLSLEELTKTRIEVTLFSSLRVPLTLSERKTNLVYPEKGYLLTDGNKKGWYLPQVFNSIHFKHLENFLEDLSLKKAQLKKEDFKKAKVSIFEVDDFIESTGHNKVLSLWGPTPVPNTHISLGEEGRVRKIKMAADWLVRSQESDGNIPPIIDPLSRRVTRQIDWARLAFTAWALSEFDKAAGTETYIQTVKKSYAYLNTHLLGSHAPKILNYELALAYLGQLTLSLNESKEVLNIAEIINERLPLATFEPIAITQITSFYKALSKKDDSFKKQFQKFMAILRECFESELKKNKSVSLALWAEMVNIFHDTDSEFSKKIVTWLKAQQLPGGAFPESTTSDFVYTRGTSKIFEVLAIDCKSNKKELDRALTWLLSMQYDAESLFFVPEENHSNFLGAFRHDYLNQEIWFDTIGHILLGEARILSNTN